MRVCIQKSTARLIEAQSGGETEAHLDILRQNAINAGYQADEIEAKFVDEDEFETLLAATQPAPPSADEALAAALARPENQAILGLIAKQQGTTVDAIQSQAVATAAAARMSPRVGEASVPRQ